MDKTTMLGKIMEKIIGLPLDMLRVLWDLVEKLSGDNGEEWLIQLKKFLRKELCWADATKQGQPQRRLYPVTIDSSMSLEDMIKAGKYDWINDDIHTKNFPSQGEALGEVVIELLHFGRNISTEDALAEMDKQGFRPATVRELAALGAAHPDVQREFPVIALGPVWQNLNGIRSVAYLDGGGSKRGLGLDWFDGDWNDNGRFAVVRK